MSDIQEELKQFMLYWPYAVMHETGKDQHEHYFVVIERTDINNKNVELFLDKYAQAYPLLEVSNSTKEYIKENKKELIFLFIDKLDKKDPFFKKREHFIKENSNNILSKKIFGAVVDMPSHINNKLEVYVGQIHEVSSTIGQFTQAKAKNFFDEKSPIIKKGLSSLRDNIKSKINKNKP